MEYTNKLYKQYIPKDAIFKPYNSQKINEIQYELNNKSRKKLNFATPKQIFFIALNEWLHLEVESPPTRSLIRANARKKIIQARKNANKLKRVNRFK